MKIQELLRQNGISFEVLNHPPGTTLSELADQGSISRRELAHVTLLRADHGYRYLLAVSSPEQPLDLHSASRALEGCDLQPASDEEQVQFCPDCEAGLMPFGSHYNVRTLLDQQLADEPSITFEEIGGAAAVRIRTADFRRLENPFVVPLTRGTPSAVR